MTARCSRYSFNLHKTGSSIGPGTTEFGLRRSGGSAIPKRWQPPRLSIAVGYGRFWSLRGRVSSLTLPTAGIPPAHGQILTIPPRPEIPRRRIIPLRRNQSATRREHPTRNRQQRTPHHPHRNRTADFHIPAQKLPPSYSQSGAGNEAARPSRPLLGALLRLRSC